MLRRLLPLLVIPLLCCSTAACNARGPMAGGSGIGSGRGGGSGNGIIGPVSVRIHPTFTQVKSWAGDDKPDGIEALLEVRDRWDEPIRATGKVIFELYDYRTGYPDPRGNRLENPWAASLATVEDQAARWDRVSRAYKFQLAYGKIDRGRTYVLTASFETDAGARLFDRLNIGPGTD